MDNVVYPKPKLKAKNHEGHISIFNKQHRPSFCRRSSGCVLINIVDWTELDFTLSHRDGQMSSHELGARAQVN